MSKLLSIGEFARATGLTPKALRLYDELALLAPARVDPVSGYRYYQPEQLDQARLVAWLRRIGLPLARIRVICGLTPLAAASEVAAYWRETESDHAARRDLVTSLINRLSRKDTTMVGERQLSIRYAVGTDRGLVRPHNQDTAYADNQLLAVADGFGPTGHNASWTAVGALRSALAQGDLLNMLTEAAVAARDSVRARVGDTPDGSGTTLTALVWSGTQLGLVHIGDSRVYLLRDGELFQITHDHTVVQTMIDEGKLTPEEAASHPDRALLVRAFTDNAELTEPQIHLHEAQAGDRYLLCSDGLHTVVSRDTLVSILTSHTSPDHAVAELVAQANHSGGPDNIACVVAHLDAA
ncbi:MerR family transcriptional regulator [Actinocrispum wychmicini]|uniref:MerR family transcriptional regulator n=1 Tax=Actinocrispum wychmicini TaxID=1213861 RepID=UPI001FB79D63|nr:MerR family transcriptional regulator [Actinocrispum wychmicini]